MTSPTSPCKIPPYKVTVWESAAVFLGAIALISLGLIGLGTKFLAKATKPQQADAIANTIIRYTIPNAQGILGLNLPGARVALIANDAEQPDIQLLVARIRSDQAGGKRKIETFLDSIALGDKEGFKVTKERIEQKNFCGEIVPVTIREGRSRLSSTSRSQGSKLSVAYRATVTLSRNRYVVNLLTSGQDAKQKAAAVFDSLQCQQ
jgi:hypothetical protein